MNLHRVHVVTFELNCSIEGIIATRKTVPGLRMTEPAMAVMYVWQSSSGRESMTVLQALSIP
jgi:hypothetical protein